MVNREKKSATKTKRGRFLVLLTFISAKTFPFSQDFCCSLPDAPVAANSSTRRHSDRIATGRKSAPPPKSRSRERRGIRNGRTQRITPPRNIPTVFGTWLPLELTHITV